MKNTTSATSVGTEVLAGYDFDDALKEAMQIVHEDIRGEHTGTFPCKEHPDAPHGFLRNASHSAGRYVCECEFWEEGEE